MYSRLLNRRSLLIERAATKGGYDDDGNWVEGTKDPPFEAKGSVQPFRQGESKVDLPSGVTAKDVRLFYTRTELLQADEILEQESDRTTIDDIPYEVYHVEPWMEVGIRSDHYKVFLVREDKMNGN